MYTAKSRDTVSTRQHNTHNTEKPYWPLTMFLKSFDNNMVLEELDAEIVGNLKFSLSR